MKKVSVVLPVYNGEDYLARSIESVLDQTYTDLELIIVDDRSKDRTHKGICGTGSARDRAPEQKEPEAAACAECRVFKGVGRIPHMDVA